MRANTWTRLFLSILFIPLAVGLPCAVDLASSEGIATDAEILQLKNSLLEAFLSQDINKTLDYLHPDILVTWQNAEVSKGHEQVRAYTKRMMEGPNRVVEKVEANPQAEARMYLQDSVISIGKMNDTFFLAGEKKPLVLDSRYSAVLVRHDGKLKIAQIHFSVNAFNNNVCSLMVTKAIFFCVLGFGIICLCLLFLLLLMRKKRAQLY